MAAKKARTVKGKSKKPSKKPNKKALKKPAKPRRPAPKAKPARKAASRAPAASKAKKKGAAKPKKSSKKARRAAPTAKRGPAKAQEASKRAVKSRADKAKPAKAQTRLVKPVSKPSKAEKKAPKAVAPKVAPSARRSAPLAKGSKREAPPPPRSLTRSIDRPSQSAAHAKEPATDPKGKKAKTLPLAGPPPKKQAPLRPAANRLPLPTLKQPEAPRERVAALPLPVLGQAHAPSLEQRAQSIEARLAKLPPEFQNQYRVSYDMSFIYHDSALEGVHYTPEELRGSLLADTPAADSSLQPTFDEIRRHREAIDWVRDFATKKRLPLTVDVVKKIFLILHPEEGDVKSVKYRKDIPQHRLYFHEYAAPDKINYKVRQVVDWVNDPETRKTRGALRIAARAHYDLLRAYPFQTDSGKVSRLVMNLLLMRAGYPPAVVHSTERQKYYDALKGSANTILTMVQEAVENSIASVEKLLADRDSKSRSG